MWRAIKERSLPFGITILLPLSMSILQVSNLINAWISSQPEHYFIANNILWLLLLANIFLFLFVLGFARYSGQKRLFQQLCQYLMVACWVTIFIKYFTDATWIYVYARDQGKAGDILSRLFEGYLWH